MNNKMFYSNYINFNWDGGKVMSFSDFNGVFSHIINNKNRQNGQELLRPNPLKDIILRNYTKEQRIKDKEAFKKYCRKCDRPYRTLVTQLNVEPTEENLELIKKWANEMLNLFDKRYNIVHAQVHMNETRVGIHFVVFNMDQTRTKYGNYNKDNEKVKITGEYYLNDKNEKIEIDAITKNIMKKKNKNFKTFRYGKEVFEEIWKEGEEINKRLAKEFGIDFEQEPTTEKGFIRKYEKMDINDFRKNKSNLLESFDVVDSNNGEVKELLNHVNEWNNFFKMIGFKNNESLTEKFKSVIQGNVEINKLFHKFKSNEKMKNFEETKKEEKER